MKPNQFCRFTHLRDLFLRLVLFHMKQQDESIDREQSLQIPADPCCRTEEEKLKLYLDWTEVKTTDNLANLGTKFVPVLNRELNYDPNSEFYQYMAVRMIRHTKKYDFVDVQVKIGHFIFPRISILNIDIQSPVHDQKHMIGKGAFSQVYRCSCKDKTVAVKCFPLKNRADRNDYFFKMALQEYCIMKVASLMKAGPKIEDFLGFNIVCYRQCIEITMELCQQIQFQSEKQLRKEVTKISQALRQSLLNLHSFNIIHFDIKFDNICYSPAFNKYVFIDFGLSRLIKQGFGFKTITVFRGSCNSSSPEMYELYTNEGQGWIDLYYNDMHGLKATLTYMLERTEEIIICSRYSFGEQEAYLNMASVLRIFLLKYFIYQQKSQQIMNQIKMEKNQEIILQILLFLKDYDYSQRLIQVRFYLQKKVKGFQEIITDLYGDSSKINTNYDGSDYGKIKIASLLESACQPNTLDFYLSHLGQNRQKNVFLYQQLLTKQSGLSQLHIEDYLVMLSKAVQINSTPYNIQQLGGICYTAMKYLKAKIDRFKDSARDVIELLKVSVFLFEQSFKHKLKGKYLSICLCMLNNAVVLRLYSFAQLFSYYKVALGILLDFPNKVRLLLNFNLTFQWLGYECDNYNEASQSNIERFAINKQFLGKISMDERNPEKLKLIQAALQFKQSIQIVNPLKDTQKLLLIGRNYELLIDLKLWIAFKAIKFEPNADENHLINIRYLLRQKSYYSNEKIIYIQYVLLKFYMKKRSTHYIMQFLTQSDKLNILGPNPAITMLRAILQLQRGKYSQKSIQDFVNEVKLKLNQTRNIIVLNYLWDELRNAFVLVKSQRQIQDIYDLMKSLFLRDNFQDVELLGRINNINRMICLQMQMSRRLPSRVQENIKLSQNKKQYLAGYLQIQRCLHQSSKDQSNADKLMVIMVLSLILLLQRSHKKELLQLIDRAYIIAKSINIPAIMLKFLDYLLNTIACYTPYPQRQQLFGNYYLLHKQIVQAQGQIFRYFRQACIAIEIIDILYKTNPQQLLEFIKRLCENLRIYNSKTNVLCFFMITKSIFDRNRNFLPFQETNKYLKNALIVCVNPFYIIWIFAIQVISVNNQKEIKQFMTQFASAANYLLLELRQEIFRFILLLNLIYNFRKMHSRKFRRLFVFLIKIQGSWMSRDQIYKSYKKLFGWRVRKQSYKIELTCLSIKILRLTQPRDQGQSHFDKSLQRRWISIVQWVRGQVIREKKKKIYRWMA